MVFFMIIVAIVLAASIAAVAYRFVQSAKNISHRHALEIEQEKTKQFKLAAGIVDEFDEKDVRARLEEMLERTQSALAQQERRAVLSKEAAEREKNEIIRRYELKIRELFAYPSPIVGFHHEDDPITAPTEWMPRSRPIIRQEALNDKDWEAEELRLSIQKEMQKFDEED